MNLVQRIAGAARLLATGKLALSTGFDGAQMQRRLMAWRAGGESINGLMLQGGELQRARARQLVRSNPYAANASASFTAHAVGCGIKPSSLVEDGALKDQIQRLWLAWTDEADADGLTDFYGLQAMAARAMFEAGECFLRFRPRRPEDGLAVPLQLQMLSSEHLPLAKCETLPSGNEVVFGIELDRIGRRVIAPRPDTIVGFGETRVHAETATFEVRASEVASPRPDDQLTVGAETFVVQGEPERRDPDRLVWTLDVRSA